MHERVRNNRFFSSTKEFREAITGFFDSTLVKIAPFLRGRINDNFSNHRPRTFKLNGYIVEGVMLQGSRVRFYSVAELLHQVSTETE